MSAALRVVLDTHVVLSALVSGGGLVGRLRVGWRQGVFVPMASTATAQELVRVLVLLRPAGCAVHAFGGSGQGGCNAFWRPRLAGPGG